jgi:hypothetical protein
MCVRGRKQSERSKRENLNFSSEASPFASFFSLKPSDNSLVIAARAEAKEQDEAKGGQTEDEREMLE